MGTRKLSDINFREATITEYHTHEKVVGHVEYGRVYGDGSVEIRWRDGPGNRTTIFSSDNWDITVEEQTVEFQRIRQNQETFNAPWPTVDLYTIELHRS